MRAFSRLSCFTLGAAALIAFDASAKPPAKPAPQAPAAAAAVASTPTVDLSKMATDQLMVDAKRLHAELDYDEVLPLVREVLARNPPVDVALDAYVLEGSCLAIVGNPIDAEQPFRRLLRGRPDFNLPDDTAPKIMAVFRKVQAEETAIATQMKQLSRKRLIDQMDMAGTNPSEVKGGKPAVFSYALKDPSLSANMRIQYKKRGEAAYSSLALVRDATGRFRGQIPGEWTANPSGAVMEYYVESFDVDGPLLTAGTSQQPLTANLSAGEVDLSKPPPLPPWSIYAGGGTTAALLAGGVTAGVSMWFVQQAYNAQAELATKEPQPGAELVEKRQQGEVLSYIANGLFVATGVSAVATTVAGVFFTDWEGRLDEEEEAAPTPKPAPSPTEGKTTASLGVVVGSLR